MERLKRQKIAVVKVTVFLDRDLMEQDVIDLSKRQNGDDGETKATDWPKFVNLEESTLTIAWPTRVTEPRKLARGIFWDYTC